MKISPIPTLLLLSLLCACEAVERDVDGSGASDTNTSTDTAADTSSDSSSQARCVDEINRYRATLSLPPLTRWTDAEACSDAEAKSDSETGQAHGAFGQCQESAQNECPGWPSTDAVISGCLKSMWDEGPPNETPCSGQCFQDHGHFINMSSESFTQVACGFYTTPSGDIWSVQNFK